MRATARYELGQIGSTGLFAPLSMPRAQEQKFFCHFTDVLNTLILAMML
jgi:hypothetical protein